MFMAMICTLASETGATLMLAHVAPSQEAKVHILAINMVLMPTFEEKLDFRVLQILG